MRKQLITIDEAIPAKTQHKKPCSDCPLSRKALHGWLGGGSIDEWLTDLHGEAKLDCHTRAGAQCAGAAIYRANVLKSPRDKNLLRLPADVNLVFATPNEFRQHHAKVNKT